MTRLAPAAVIALSACSEFLECPTIEAFPGCPPEAMTVPEAMEGLQSIFVSERGLAPTTPLIEAAPDFRVGDAVPFAMAEFEAWVRAEIPCAAVSTSDGNMVWADFGNLDDECAYDGVIYAGNWGALFDDETYPEEPRVIHRWEAFTNGTRTLDGHAIAWWNAEDGTRTIHHDLEWTELGTTVGSTGSRVQSLVDADLGVGGGIAIEGDRNWMITNSALEGSWLLEMAGIEVRGVDPVPQAGSCTLMNPAGRTVTMTFEAIDDDTALVTFVDYEQPYAFRVDRATGERVEREE